MIEMGLILLPLRLLLQCLLDLLPQFGRLEESPIDIVLLHHDFSVEKTQSLHHDRNQTHDVIGVLLAVDHQTQNGHCIVVTLQESLFILLEGDLRCAIPAGKIKR